MINKLSYCFHTHTKRCGHAHGSDEGYVINAINNGFSTIGFSDHIFLPNVYDPYMRGDYDLLDDYVSSLSQLRDKYSSSIKINIGFEAEYFEKYEQLYRYLLESGKIQYLILGNHLYEHLDGSLRWFTNQIDNVEIYANKVVKAIESKLFLYVAHPDLMIYFYGKWDEYTEDAARKIIAASEANNVPLELNLAHIRNRHFMHGTDSEFHYPNKNFWRLVGDSKCKVVIGVDAHSPSDFKIDEFTINTINNIIIECKLDVIKEFEFDSNYYKKR